MSTITITKSEKPESAFPLRLTFRDFPIWSFEFSELSLRSSSTPASSAPYANIEAQEATGFLLRILGTLPPRQQEVLQLKFQNDLSYQEISEITQLSVSNVGVLIHNALKTLRQRYGQASKDFLPFTPRIVS